MHHLGSPAIAFADDFTRNGKWRGPFQRRRRRGPSIARLLLAGLAVFAFVKLMSASSRPRSTAEKIVLGVLLLAIGAIILSMRRSARRYQWSP